MKINFERIVVGLATLIFCFALIFADAEGYINISKFGYAGVGSWITLIIQFYFRKQPRNGGTSK